ncbi:MAG TPA: RagB/SusD family nutrient uptake outer membrane protein, partial [Gemmatimonadales bacterium]|nr:RagB/SusD family nutrient uptake outer membrane protein [Gemmatimonadales bacterium]
SSYRAFLAKVYTGLTVTGQRGAAGQPDLDPSFDEGFSSYLRLYWEAQELPTDEAVIGWNDTGIEELNTQLWGVTNGFLNIMYYRIFFQIGMANEFLRQTTDAKLASRGHTSPALQAEVATYRAEARFLRALSYWHGLDLYGNIPLVTDADVLGATPPQQASRAELFDFVVNELNEIQGELPAVSAANYGRATGPAASMLLAKLYLNAGVYTGTTKYAEALAAAQAIIGNSAYSLDNNYQDIFLADNNTSPEIIFSVPQDGLKTQTWGGMTFLVHAACGNQMNPADYGIDGCWWGLRLKPEAYNRYTTGDKRDDFFFTTGQTVAVTAIGDFTKGIPAPKYRNITSTGAQGSHPTFPDTDYPMFRLADAYLIYAEAHLRGGGGSATQALTYVNALRQRAWGNANGNITAGQLTLDFILDERGRELLWEANRRTDLVRYGRYTGGTYLWAWKGGVQAGTGTPDHLNLYPLPGNELIANPNLTQNPGY